MASSNNTPTFSQVWQRWLALQQRDSAANSAFFYGVDSTRIFCRPNCPGRLARRANIAFFDNICAAQDAGYRPCQRCEPCNEQWRVDHQSRITFQRASELITKAVQEGAHWKVGSIATEVGTSSGHLHRLFKRFANTTPRLFAEAAPSTVVDSRSEPDATSCSIPTMPPTSATPNRPQDSDPNLQFEADCLWVESPFDVESGELNLIPFLDNWETAMHASLDGNPNMPYNNMAWKELGAGEAYTNFSRNPVEESSVFLDIDWSQEIGPFIFDIES